MGTACLGSSWIQTWANHGPLGLVRPSLVPYSHFYGIQYWSVTISKSDPNPTVKPYLVVTFKPDHNRVLIFGFKLINDAISISVESRTIYVGNVGASFHYCCYIMFILDDFKDIYHFHFPSLILLKGTLCDDILYLSYRPHVICITLLTKKK